MTIRPSRACAVPVAALAVALFAAACAGGGSARPSAAPRGTRATGAGATTAPSTTARAARHRAARSTTTATLGVTVTTSGAVELGLPPVTPGAPTPGTPPSTAAVTTTTLPHAVPYDPSKPINLCCEPGVTLAEQHRAEQLVRDTLRDLPKYADPQVAYAAGYRSIGDELTGDEHYVNWAYVNDGHILDSQYPESLVYEIRNGRKTLVSAMYMLPFGDTFADVPDVGGPLTQWHVHNNLCLADNPSDPLQKVVSSLTTVDGTCPAGSTKAGSSPMLHVWIVKNKCGPFAGLEGIGAGQVPTGETPFCDLLHGSV